MASTSSSQPKYAMYQPYVGHLGSEYIKSRKASVENLDLNSRLSNLKDKQVDENSTD